MDLILSDDYPTQVKALRARLDYTQESLAEALGVSFATVNRWENGKSKPSQVYWYRLLELHREATQPNITAEPEPPPYTATPPLLDFTANPERVRVLVEGERLSFGHMANPTFATEISSIDPLPHQRIAVYDHMLKQSRLRFLLADDAGAGKTIMTGLYIREMLSRRLLKRVLIVPPAGLIGNWQNELHTLFNLNFKIISGSDTRNGNPFIGPGSDQLIVSVDTLAGGRAFSRLQDKDIEPYDLVVFDEAHKLSCSQGSDLRERKTDRYKLAEAIAGVYTGDEKWLLPWHTHHLLLLTATPHMGKDYPYYALWRLLEPDILTTFDAFDHFADEQRHKYFIRRTKEEMVHLDGSPLYPTRLADTLGYDLTQGDVSEQRLYDETTEYLRDVYNKAKLLNRSAARLAMSVFQRRLASSTYALLCSFKRRIEKLDAIIDDVQQGRITFEQLLLLQRRITDDDDVFDAKTADDESGEGDEEENQNAEDKLLQGVIAASLGDLVAEKEQVIQLRNLAQQVFDNGQESKFDKLREVLSEERYTNEKLIIFTEHKDTLTFLVRRLEGMGYTGQIATIHGGMHYTARQEQVEFFRKPIEEGGARFMVCTDAAAEGINLQFCWIMINYDVPWNPARLEQRMGRIHRYGQKHDPVVILNLVAPGTREGKVLKTLLDKLQKIRQRLQSDKVYDSIGRIFSDVSIKQYMEMVVIDNADAIVAQLDGQMTEEQVKAIEEREKRLYGDGGDVAQELPRLRSDLEQESFFRLLPGYVRRFISSAAPHMGMKVDGDLGAHFDLKPVQTGAVDPLLSILETYPEKQRSQLSVLRPEDRQSCIWMHPGEPVFECFRELVRNRLGEDALKGAIFVDPTATKPYIFHLARLTVVRKADPDYPELGQDDTLDCQLVGIRQTESTVISLCPVEHLLLLRGGQGLPQKAQRLAATAENHRDLARSYLAERVARTISVEHRGRMLDSVPEREAFIKRGFDYQEAELAAIRSQLTRKAREGNKAAAQHLAEVKTRQRALSARRERSLAILHREPELIAPGPIEFIAHALVVPSADQADKKQHEANVEQVAMELTRAYEEAAGANVKFVHTPALARAAGLSDNPGFDMLSEYPNGERRCIEVKGRSATNEIEISDNEWAKACNLRQDYWLYAVFHCDTPTPQMIRVQDPFDKLLVRPFTRTQIVTKTQQSSGVRIGHTQVMEAGELS